MKRTMIGLLGLIMLGNPAAYAEVIESGQDFFTCFQNYVVQNLAKDGFEGWEQSPIVFNRGHDYVAGWSTLFNTPGCVGNEYAEFTASSDPKVSPVNCTATNESPSTMKCTPNITSGDIQLDHVCYSGGKKISEPKAFAFVAGSKMYCYDLVMP